MRITLFHRSPGVFTVREWLTVCAMVVIVAALALATGYRISRNSQVEHFDTRSNTLLRGVGERVIELRGVIKSMLGMHYASDEFAGVDIDAFAEQLRNYSPFVHSLGMFTIVDGDLLAEFELQGAMFEQTRFQVHSYAATGERIPVSARSLHVPVISIDPLDQVGSEFLGVDLVNEPIIADSLQAAILSGRGILVPKPDRWPISGDALLLQPVYFADQPPEDEAQRRDLYAGGIWVAIDVPRMLGALISETDEKIDLTVAALGGRPADLYHREATALPPGLNLGFGDAASSRSWVVGNSVLDMTVHAGLRSPPGHVFSIIGATMLACLTTLAITGFFYQRRIVQAERMRGLEAIALERQNAEHTLDSISDAVISIDAATNVVHLNPTACRWFSFETDALLGRPLAEHLVMVERGEADGEALDLTSLITRLSPEGRLIVDIGLPETDRPDTTFQLTFSRMSGGADVAAGFTLVLQDVSKERELRAELEHRAHHDSLTGCYNRFYFERRLRELVAEAEHSERQHALSYIDLDQFKIVNDTCGHAAGDRLLVELTTAIKGHLRKQDLFARLGGDEFGILICDAGPESAYAVARKVFDHFQTAAFEHEGHIFPVRGSMGLVSISRNFCDLKEVMSAADNACYIAKAKGRNALIVYSEQDTAIQHQQDDMQWPPRLEKALVEDGFCLLVQPIEQLTEPACGSPTEYHEFLLRLVGADGELIQPERFMKSAERYDLIQDIDRWSIDHGLALISSAGRAVSAQSCYAFNLSGKTIASPALLEYVAERFRHYDLEPSRFWFEITESSVITHFAHARALMEGLRAMGCRVALDAFGAGLSSFAYLSKLPVDIVKIDGQFVRDVCSSESNLAMVRAMQQAARAMHLETVAECVESGPVLEQIRCLDIDYAQGARIGDPIPFESILDPGETRSAA